MDKLTELKQRLNHIENLPTPMSPCAPTLSPAFMKSDAFAGHHLDVSGLAPLDETIYEGHSIHQRPQPPPAVAAHQPHRHVSPTEPASARSRHVSDHHTGAADARTGHSTFASDARTNEFIGRSVTFEDANFHGGLTMPTSASKKKAGKVFLFMVIGWMSIYLEMRSCI